MTFPFVIVGLSALYYFLFVSRVAAGLRILAARKTTEPLTSVTVIVAARNEEANIRECLQSIMAQKYPSDLLRVIVVDDGSEDATAEIVRSFAQRDPRARLLTLPPREADGIGRKPEAIRMAVEHASSVLVVTTDADCTHGSEWLKAMASSFDMSTGLVAGPVVLLTGTTLFSRIERMDFLGLVATGAGLIGAGRPIICNGANLAYRRETYLQALDDVQHSSNDDGTLMSRIVTRRLAGVSFAHTPEAVVRTAGQNNVRSFFRQRRRWAAVRGRFLDPSIYLELIGLFIFFMSLLVVTFLAIGQSEWRLPALALWIGKMALDWRATSIASASWNVPVAFSDFFVAELFHPFSIVLATLGSLFAPFSWKGRTLVR